MNDASVMLKKFGTVDINKIVKGHKVGNLWHVYVYDDWHVVPQCDVEDIPGYIKNKC
ncbi:hypothetical protein SAMN05446037_1006160 [Anaerovirgula multivorans]|uniref:Uncharacterized protein n=1 Tax=Anaerovirgula multivorans TaxID=312168 RepID=A0A239CU46_9FIRM|nr:hypothetical protein [Anaerovirgula multivorans]SNS23766.1 hypothetical protein SAMN05446037_1006160 [Anaerovirgula multivorans]